jgi:hypothetical protein
MRSLLKEEKETLLEGHHSPATSTSIWMGCSVDDSCLTEPVPDKGNCLDCEWRQKGPLEDQRDDYSHSDPQQQPPAPVRSSWLCMPELELKDVMPRTCHSQEQTFLAPRFQQQSQQQQHPQNFQQAFENGRILPYIVDCIIADLSPTQALGPPAPTAERQWNGHLPLSPVVNVDAAPLPSLLAKRNRHLPPKQSTNSFQAHLQSVCPGSSIFTRFRFTAIDIVFSFFISSFSSSCRI